MLYQGYGVTAILFAGFISAALQVVVLVYLQTKQNKKVHDTAYLFSKEMMTLCIPYCLPLMASGLVAFGLNGFERWILAENTSFSDLALYAVALKFALALTLLMQPFCMWWMPKRFDYLQSRGKAITAKMTQSSLVLLCGLTVLVCYLAPVLIEWLMPASYQQAKTIAVALIIVSAIKELNELINLGALAEKQTKKLLWINTLATGLGMIAILILTPIYGVSGVITSLILAQTIRVILTFILSQSAHPLPYSLGKLSVLLLITSVSIALSLSSFSIAIQLMMAVLCTVSVVIFASQLQLITLPECEESEKCL